MARLLEERLSELREELAKGNAELRSLEERKTALRDTLLRITGAVQVLEEVIAQRQIIESATRTSDNATGC